ncbi:MAG: hypothetical protein EHM35_13270 [Planctomycetaceae bacterium]|nr:MAG: hypothetical protein EHM35_13270 [Planctomycetaceae bacterium]
MPDKVFKPEEMLQIEMVSHAVLNDALGRYIHDPRNLRTIQDVLRNLLDDLSKIQPEHKGCPPGYFHRDCSCVVNLDVDPEL